MTAILSDDIQVVDLVQTFHASLARVFAAFTDPRALARWFRPTSHHHVILAEADARPGGRYAIEVQAPTGENYRIEGEYQEVNPNRRLRMSWVWVKGAPMPGIGTTHVTVDFEATAHGTRVHLRHERFADQSKRNIHSAGWQGSFALLSQDLKETNQ